MPLIEMIEFPLPAAEARGDLVRLYFDLMLASQKKITIVDEGSSIWEEHIKLVANMTDGYSGRAISKLMISIQGYVFGKEEPTLSANEFMDAVRMKMESYEKRGRLLELQEGYESHVATKE